MTSQIHRHTFLIDTFQTNCKIYTFWARTNHASPLISIAEGALLFLGLKFELVLVGAFDLNLVEALKALIVVARVTHPELARLLFVAAVARQVLINLFQRPGVSGLTVV